MTVETWTGLNNQVSSGGSKPVDVYPVYSNTAFAETCVYVERGTFRNVKFISRMYIFLYIIKHLFDNVQR